MLSSIKKNDKVMVIAGKDRGKQGNIIEVFPKKGKVRVKGVSIITRHVKPRRQGETGGIVKVDDDLYQIKSSSNPEKSYFVTSDTCECPGFKNFYKFHHGKGLKANCSHLEAIRIFKES